MTRVLRGMSNATAFQALGWWKAFVATKNKMKQDNLRMQRFLRKLMHQGLLRTFVSWMDYVEWCQYAKGIMTRTIKRMMHAKVHHAIVLWKHYAVVLAKM